MKKLSLKWLVIVALGLLTIAYLFVNSSKFRLSGPGPLLSLIFGDDTEYAKHYTDEKFLQVRLKMRKAEVVMMLGKPLDSAYEYRVKSNGETMAFEDTGSGSLIPHGLKPNKEKFIFHDSMEMKQKLGEPDFEILRYSRPKGGGSYHVRVIRFSQGEVAEKISEFYVD